MEPPAQRNVDDGWTWALEWGRESGSFLARCDCALMSEVMRSQQRRPRRAEGTAAVRMIMIGRGIQL
jgi:hypothetical protein